MVFAFFLWVGGLKGSLKGCVKESILGCWVSVCGEVVGFKVGDVLLLTVAAIAPYCSCNCIHVAASFLCVTLPVFLFFHTTATTTTATTTTTAAITSTTTSATSTTWTPQSMQNNSLLVGIGLLFYLLLGV